MHSICEGQKKDETQVNQTNLSKKLLWDNGYFH